VEPRFARVWERIFWQYTDGREETCKELVPR